jgi:hypothetical protein
MAETATCVFSSKVEQLLAVVEASGFALQKDGKVSADRAAMRRVVLPLGRVQRGERGRARREDTNRQKKQGRRPVVGEPPLSFARHLSVCLCLAPRAPHAVARSRDTRSKCRARASWPAAPSRARAKAERERERERARRGKGRERGHVAPSPSPPRRPPPRKTQVPPPPQPPTTNITTTQQPVGGLAVARPYLECALLAEGRRLDRASARAAAGADLLFCSSTATSPASSCLTVAGCAQPCPLAPVGDEGQEQEGDDAAALPPSGKNDGSSNASTAAAAALLPSDLGASLRKALGPQAVTELRWARVPSVALLARGYIPEAALAAAALEGVPVSPSLAGPHQEEVPTIVDVFLKAPSAAAGKGKGGGGGAGGNGNNNNNNSNAQASSGRFPDNRLMLLRDGGFLALGSDIDEAAAAFARAARARLLGEGAYAAVSEACGLLPVAAAAAAAGPSSSSAAAAACGATTAATAVAVAAVAATAAAATATAITTSTTIPTSTSTPTLAAFDGLGSGALAVGSHPLLLLGSSGGMAAAAAEGGQKQGGGAAPQSSAPGGTPSSRRPNSNNNQSDTARAVPMFSLGGAATALRRLGHSLLGGRPTLGGRHSDGATDLIALGGTGGGAAAGGAGASRMGHAASMRPSLPGLRGLFQGGGAANGTSPFALPSAGPPSAAGLPPAHSGAGAGAQRSRTSQGNGGTAGGLLAPSGGSITGLCRKGSESHRPALPSSFTFGGLKPW